MAKVLTGAEVREIMSEYRANREISEYREGVEHFVRSPAELARGYGRDIQLRPGLTLNVMDFEKHQIHRYRVRQHPQPMPLTFSYYLAGGCRVNNDGLDGEVEEVAGKSYVYCLPNTAELEEYPCGQRICRIHIRVAPELMQGFCDRTHPLPTDIRTAIEQPKQTLLYYACRITPAQQQILQQILDWPYHGSIRKLYLESKVLELLALQLDNLAPQVPSSGSSSKARDLDRIYEARDILIHNAVNPPSLSELSRQVHLNEHKLTQGFRQVFDNTVFGYLHDHRMQQACHLLQTSSLNIQEIAHSIGYASRSSFVAAFKKRYKLAPSQYLKQAS